MISRRRCKAIARDWVMAHGIAEYNRRQKEIERYDRLHHLGRAWRDELWRDMALALLDGYYDPPMPTIPGFFTRLRLRTWTPPTPTPQQWPMGTTQRREDDSNRIPNL